MCNRCVKIVSGMAGVLVAESAGDDPDVMIQAEDRPGQQERLRHIIEQTRCHIGNFYHLITHQCNAAHNEQHCTGILRDFKNFPFHDIRLSILLILYSLLPYKVTKKNREYQII